jgi:hypothetical protein
MFPQTNAQSSLSVSHHPVPAFQALLAIGAMLAMLAVVPYACLQFDDSAARAHLIVQGAEVILATWIAGLAVSALHLMSVVAGDAIARNTEFSSGNASAGV